MQRKMYDDANDVAPKRSQLRNLAAIQAAMQAQAANEMMRPIVQQQQLQASDDLQVQQRASLNQKFDAFVTLKPKVVQPAAEAPAVDAQQDIESFLTHPKWTDVNLKSKIEEYAKRGIIDDEDRYRRTLLRAKNKRIRADLLLARIQAHAPLPRQQSVRQQKS